MVTFHMTELERLALLVALEAPEQQPTFSTSVRIPWWLVSKIRERLEQGGYDWRRGHRTRLRLLQEWREESA